MQSREKYISCGGKSFTYIPALNDYDKNIEAMEQIILGEIGNWDNDNMNSKENLETTKKLFDKSAKRVQKIIKIFCEQVQAR